MAAFAKFAGLLGRWRDDPKAAVQQIPQDMSTAGRNVGAMTAGLLGDVASIVPGSQHSISAQAPTSEELVDTFGGDREHWSYYPSMAVAPGPGEGAALVAKGKGLLASAPIIGKFGKKGKKGKGLLDGEVKLSPMADKRTADEVMAKGVMSPEGTPLDVAEKNTRDAIAEWHDWTAKKLGYKDGAEYSAVLKAEDKQYELFTQNPARMKAALDGDPVSIEGTGLRPELLQETPYITKEERLAVPMRERIALLDKNKARIEKDIATAILLKEFRSPLSGGDAWKARQEELLNMSRPELKAEIDRVFDTGPTSERAARRGMSVVPESGLLGKAGDDALPQATVLATLAEDASSLGFKKVKKTGAYVGAPPGVKGDEDIVRLAEEYADRVQRALDAGVDKDYFYLKGQRAIEGVTDDATNAKQLADANAITSSEAPVRNNYGWSVQAFEQRAAGMPIRTGKYPVEASEKIDSIFAGQEPHLGEKRHLYGQGLSGEGRKLPEELRNAPNDRWEIRSFGYDKDSAGPAQHKFMHGVRRIAKDIINERLGTDLDIYNVQELNWATTRADTMGISIPESATDTIQAAIPQYRFQHSWETVPGQGLLDVDMPAHDKALRDIYLDKGGKDNLIRAFGGELQEPALQNVPGVFEGNVNPYGYQSRSQVYHAGGKLADSSTDRIKATETTRSFLNVQDAAAGSLIAPSKRKTVKPFGGALRFDLGRPINQEEAQQVVDTLRKYHGINDFGVVPNEGGVDILATGAKGLEKQGKELHGLLGNQGVVSDFSDTGFYAELPWGERKATETMLESLSPAMRNRADSDEMRVIAGQLYDYYKGLPSDPPKGFRDVLKAWATDGIDGVQDLVKKGLAPAGVLGILVGSQLKQEETNRGLL